MQIIFNGNSNKRYICIEETLCVCVCVCVCSRVLLKCKRVEKAFDIDIKRGMESAPIASVIKALYTFPRPTPTTYILN